MIGVAADGHREVPGFEVGLGRFGEDLAWLRASGGLPENGGGGCAGVAH
jgi:hypothetical protein